MVMINNVFIAYYCTDDCFKVILFIRVVKG